MGCEFQMVFDLKLSRQAHKQLIFLKSGASVLQVEVRKPQPRTMRHLANQART